MTMCVCVCVNVLRIFSKMFIFHLKTLKTKKQQILASKWIEFHQSMLWSKKKKCYLLWQQVSSHNKVLWRQNDEKFNFLSPLWGAKNVSNEKSLFCLTYKFILKLLSCKMAEIFFLVLFLANPISIYTTLNHILL